MSDVPETLDVFQELETKDLALQSDTEVLKDEFIRLAAMNGHGGSVRRKIRRSLRRFLEHPRWVE